MQSTYLTKPFTNLQACGVPEVKIELHEDFFAGVLLSARIIPSYCQT